MFSYPLPNVLNMAAAVSDRCARRGSTLQVAVRRRQVCQHGPHLLEEEFEKILSTPAVCRVGRVLDSLLPVTGSPRSSLVGLLPDDVVFRFSTAGYGSHAELSHP